MSVMGKDLQRQEHFYGAICGNDMKFLHRGWRNGVQFPPRTHTSTLTLGQIEKADRSPLRKVISNYCG